MHWQTNLDPEIWKYEVEHVDTDSVGVMHFSRYASLAETASLKLLKGLGLGLGDLEALGLTLVIRECLITYSHPVLFSQILAIKPTLSKRGVARIEVTSELFIDGRDKTVLAAKARLLFVCVSHSSMKVSPLPDNTK